MKTGNCVIFIGKNMPAHSLVDLFNNMSSSNHWGKIEMRRMDELGEKCKVEEDAPMQATSADTKPMDAHAQETKI